MKVLYTSLTFVLLLSAALAMRADLGFDAPVLAQSARSAPEWQVEGWINSEPLRLSELRGKVVLVYFWTYSCINCVRTVPYLNKWHEKYKGRGLVVVGIHTPEFGFEAQRINVDDAVKRFGITFPVAQDNEYATWKGYDNIAWPAFYLIDQEGRIANVRYGEGEYHRTENRIRQLLGIEGSVAQNDGADLSRVRTPEIYLGSAHENHQSVQQDPVGRSRSYKLPNTLRSNEFALGGTWLRTEQLASLDADDGVIVLRFNAAKVHLVAGASLPAEIVVRIDDGPPHRVLIGKPQLYTLYDGNEYRDHTMRIDIPMRGFDAYSFTFG